jgi:Ser/Thr protein kinase RdoA (MazF antagonist)
MQPFPVTSSILSATHLAQFLQSNYSFGPNTFCQLLKAGINHAYLVTDGGKKAIFRVYSLNWRTEEEIKEEIRLLTLLQENSLPVSYPIADHNGNYIQPLNAPEGGRMGVLFSFAEGEKILSLSAELHYKIGQIMARFHQIIHNLTLKRNTYTAQVLVVDSVEKLALFLPAESPEMAFMYATQRYLLDVFARIDDDNVRRGVVHLDIWFDNLNITPDGMVTLFDFDFCGNGLLCYDIAYYIMQIHSTEPDETEFLTKKDQFLSGYESVTKISDEEKKLLPMLGEAVYFFYIGVQCERFDNFSNVYLNEVYLKRFINLRLKRWFDYNKLNAG